MPSPSRRPVVDLDGDSRLLGRGGNSSAYAVSDRAASSAGFDREVVALVPVAAEAAKPAPGGGMPPELAALQAKLIAGATRERAVGVVVDDAVGRISGAADTHREPGFLDRIRDAIAAATGGAPSPDRDAAMASAALRRAGIAVGGMRVHGAVDVRVDGDTLLPAVLVDRVRGVSASEAAFQGWLKPSEGLLIGAGMALLGSEQLRAGWFNADVKPLNIVVERKGAGLDVTAIDYGDTHTIESHRCSPRYVGTPGYTCFGAMTGTVSAAVSATESAIAGLRESSSPSATRWAAEATLAASLDDRGDPLPRDAAWAARVRRSLEAGSGRSAARAAVADAVSRTVARGVLFRSSPEAAFVDGIGKALAPTDADRAMLGHAASHAAAVTALSLLIKGDDPLRARLERMPEQERFAAMFESSGPGAKRASLYLDDLHVVRATLNREHGDKVGDVVADGLGSILLSRRPVPPHRAAAILAGLAAAIPASGSTSTP